MQISMKREISLDKASVSCGAILIFISLTVISGFIRIPVPMSPVPVTLQTFFVLLAGASLGAWKGSLSQLGYLVFGVCGLPVFSSMGSGLLYLAGPTGGYIAGFVFAAFFTGFMRRFVGTSYAGLLALFLVADAVILCTGALWLKALTGYGLVELVQIGILPFVPGDIIKAAGAAAAYKFISPGLERIL